MDNNSEEKSTGTILISVILASWILGTIIALFRIPDNGDRSWKTIFAVGQFFAGIGLVTTVSELINLCIYRNRRCDGVRSAEIPQCRSA